MTATDARQEPQPTEPLEATEATETAEPTEVAILETAPIEEIAVAAPPRASALRVEHVAWALVLIVASLFRFVDLGGTPLSAVEGGRALGSWSVAQGRLTDSWPGGVLDALTALLFRLFGGADATARVVPAVAGVLLVASFWLLRPHVGRGAALLAALFASVSPLFVLDARSATSDAAGAALAVALAALVLRLLERPRPRVVVGVVVAVCFGLTTDAVFLGAAGLVALWVVLHWVWRRDPAVPAVGRVVRRWDDWARSAAPLGLAGLLLATSRFGLGFSRLRPAAARSWALAFEPSRPGAPWHYLLDVLAGYELPLTLLGAAGVWLVVRRRGWRAEPVFGLLLAWLAGGLVLNFFMAGRLPSSLLLSLVPLCLLAGVAAARLIRVCAAWWFDPLDLVLAVGLAVASIYFYITALAYTGPQPSGGYQVLAGLLLILLCLAGIVVRIAQGGVPTIAPSLGVLAVVALFFSVHGASSLAFDTGDEPALGQRTTREAVAMARLLENNGGGVSTVTDQALPALAWYLRDTVQSGGHGGARLIAGNGQASTGFHQDGSPATLSRAWSPPSWSGRGMIRWWVYREAWGGPAAVHSVDGQLVVEDR